MVSISNKNLDVILIGENRVENLVDLERAYKIAKIIKEVKPEYILYEGCDENSNNDKIWKILDKICKNLGNMNLENLIKGITLEDVGFTKETLNKEKLKKILSNAIEKYENKEKNFIDEIYLNNTRVELEYLPDSYEEIVKTPLIFYNPAIIEYFIDILNKKLEEVKGKNERLEKTIDFLISRLELVKLSNKMYRNFFTYKLIGFIILSAICEVNAQIGRCDIDSQEKEKMIRNATEKILNDFKVDLHKYKREKIMAETIEKYVKKKRKDSPIIAIVGRAHVKNIAKYLENKGIKYRIIEILTNNIKYYNSKYKV